MRTERNKGGTWNVWMEQQEYEELPRARPTPVAEIAIRLMGDCGLRSFEVLDVRPKHITRVSDERHYKLEVIGGKDTTGEYDGGKYRETWMPRNTENIVRNYIQTADIDHDEPIIKVTKRTIQNWLYKTTDEAADRTGDDDYRKISTHDLRRYWANHLLVEKGVAPRVVMSLGGWSSYNAIEPYLAAPTESNIIDEMSGVLS